MNFRLINSILSRVIMLQGILLLPSCLVGILYHEWHDVLVYLICFHLLYFIWIASVSG